jgi:hypothetical protein
MIYILIICLNKFKIKEIKFYKKKDLHFQFLKMVKCKILNWSNWIKIKLKRYISNSLAIINVER